MNDVMVIVKENWLWPGKYEITVPPSKKFEISVKLLKEADNKKSN